MYLLMLVSCLRNNFKKFPYHFNTIASEFCFYSLRVNTPRLAAKEIVGFCSEYPAACGGVFY